MTAHWLRPHPRLASARGQLEEDGVTSAEYDLHRPRPKRQGALDNGAASALPGKIRCFHWRPLWRAPWSAARQAAARFQANLERDASTISIMALWQ